MAPTSKSNNNDAKGDAQDDAENDAEGDGLNAEIDGPEQHAYALIHYHGEGGGTANVPIDTNLIHGFDWRNPLRDYLVPRQDANGLITHWPAQVLKTGRTRKSVEPNRNEPINKEKRVVLKKKRCSELYDHLIVRDGPIGVPSEGSGDDESDDEAETGKTRKNRKIEKYATKASKSQKTKNVPKVKSVDPVDLEILQFQAREMRGLNLHNDDNDEANDLKVRLIMSENARAEAEAKLNAEIRERKIQEEMISRLASRIEQLEKQSTHQSHQVNRELRYDDEPKPSTSSMADGDSGIHMIPLKGRRFHYAKSVVSEPQPSCSTNYSESSGQPQSRDARATKEPTVKGKKGKSHKKSKSRHKRQSRRERGVFTEQQYAIFRADETLAPGAHWIFTNPKTGDKVSMKHLMFGLSITLEAWNSFKSKNPSKFARDLARALWADEKLANRAVDITRVAGQLNFQSPRKTLTPKKWACIRLLYDKQVDRKESNPTTRARMKARLNDILGQVINMAYQNQKAMQESSSDESSSSSSRSSSPRSRSRSRSPLAKSLDSIETGPKSRCSSSTKTTTYDDTTHETVPASVRQAAPTGTMSSASAQSEVARNTSVARSTAVRSGRGSRSRSPPIQRDRRHWGHQSAANRNHHKSRSRSPLDRSDRMQYGPQSDATEKYGMSRFRLPTVEPVRSHCEPRSAAGQYDRRTRSRSPFFQPFPGQCRLQSAAPQSKRRSRSRSPLIRTAGSETRLHSAATRNNRRSRSRSPFAQPLQDQSRSQSVAPQNERRSRSRSPLAKSGRSQLQPQYPKAENNGRAQARSLVTRSTSSLSPPTNFAVDQDDRGSRYRPPIAQSARSQFEPQSRPTQKYFSSQARSPVIRSTANLSTPTNFAANKVDRRTPSRAPEIQASQGRSRSRSPGAQHSHATQKTICDRPGQGAGIQESHDIEFANLEELTDRQRFSETSDEHYSRREPAMLDNRDETWDDDEQDIQREPQAQRSRSSSSEDTDKPYVRQVKKQKKNPRRSSVRRISSSSSSN
ncbi:hypothetical protein QAD02_011948 [Eretmocerus hayati]|uniref:Uncharacterized protein n=1 Tax=Eretmocerus hayati TaxID=131215 RepID=A0ACC2NYG7_9HYME|nr:hypothetical protein QAD02_011948 [Eretmocerus hayati]